MYRKREGTYYEYEFFTKALQKGFEIFIPAGDYLPQDCHLVNSDGQIFRVQIKGTQNEVWDNGRNSPRFKITASTGTGSRVPINCKAVDVIVSYVKPRNVFYIIPCEKLTAVSMWLYPDQHKSEGQYEKYRENWGYFTEAVPQSSQKNQIAEVAP